MSHVSHSDRLQPAILALAVLALLIAGAASGALDARWLWSLVAGLGALFMVGRGLTRGNPFDRHGHARPAVTPAQGVVAAASDGPAVHTPPPPPDVPSQVAAEVTLAEEQLRVDRRELPAERVRLVKHVVTEMVTVQVPVRREEVRVERLPLDAPDVPPVDGEVVQELTLMREEPLVDKQVVARERVVLNRDVHTETRHVTDQVRREEVELQQEPTAYPTEQEMR